MQLQLVMTNGHDFRISIHILYVSCIVFVYRKDDKYLGCIFEFLFIQ